MKDEIRKLIELEKNAPPDTDLPALQNSGQVKSVSNVTSGNSFTEAVDEAKINVVKEASVNDKKFNEDFKSKLKEATLKLAEVEREKANLEKQNIEYHKELLKTQQLLNEQQQSKDSWVSKQERRQFHYDGTKPLMEFVGIKNPMNLALLYFLSIILLPAFLLAKIWKGTVGALVAGAEDANRPKAVQGFLWTFLAVIIVGITVLIGFIVLKWLAIV